jgi:serine/threonine protein kinase
MIRSNGELRIIDFGFAQILSPNMKSSFSYCGTPYYLPPEFIKKLTILGIDWVSYELIKFRF